MLRHIVKYVYIFMAFALLLFFVTNHLCFTFRIKVKFDLLLRLSFYLCFTS
jgi:hypothetical protein